MSEIRRGYGSYDTSPALNRGPGQKNDDTTSSSSNIGQARFKPQFRNFVERQQFQKNEGAVRDHIKHETQKINPTEHTPLLSKKESEPSVVFQTSTAKYTKEQKELVKQVAEAFKNDKVKETQQKIALQAKKREQQEILKKSADPQEWFNEQKGFPSLLEIAYEILPESLSQILGISGDKKTEHLYTLIPSSDNRK